MHLHQLDMSKPRDIFKFAKSFRESGKVLDVLVRLLRYTYLAHFQHDIVCLSKYHSLNFQINNAGCMVNTREVTEDGLEKNFATNTLGKKISYYSFLQHFINRYLL